MEKLKRYAVVIDTYVYAENDYMARKKAHDIKNLVYKSFKSDGLRVVDIIKCPYASLTTQSLSDISEPTLDNNNMWVESDELPF